MQKSGQGDLLTGCINAERAACAIYTYSEDTFLKSILRAIYFMKILKYNDTVTRRKEGCVLKKLVESILEDLSTKEVFLFHVFCENCSAEYASKPIRFTKAGLTPTTQSKRIIYDAVYEQEYRAARQAAIRSTAEHMNYCPICKRLVCNQCFLICDDLDMCERCAGELQEQGSPVMTAVIDAVV
jgi:hypothetical protein